MSDANGEPSPAEGLDQHSSNNLVNASLPPIPLKRIIEPSFPKTSLDENGESRRPRDARIIHMILANLGVAAYQERVPLQLMDFAYRYTSSTLQDALHLTSDIYPNNTTLGGRVQPQDANTVTLQALRLSIASRTSYQFSPSLPKEHFLEIAQERNRLALPPIGKALGLRLPPEKFCLTGVGFGLKEEWESEGEETFNDENQDMVMGESAHEDGEDEGDDLEAVFGKS